MRNFIVCFTGISGSGKTTIAKALEEELNKRKQSQKIQLLDGDVLRNQWGNLFGYTKEERFKNNRVVRVLTGYLNKNGINVVLALVAPYEEMRNLMREELGKDYIEVYIQCSYEECCKRDVKGYYKQQLEGKLENLNGANDVFEIPQHSDIIINTEKETIEEGVKKIIEFLEQGYEV